MSRTHYETLGVSEAAAQAEIKRVYRRFARKYHPDRNTSKSDEERFKEITAAYFVIGDPGRRQIYDYDLRQSRKAGASAGSGSARSNAAPPPPSSGTPNSTGATASAPPPPPAQRAYRYFFFFRGVLVGGVAVGALLVLALISYVACHISPSSPVTSADAPRLSSPASDRENGDIPPTMPEPTPPRPVPAAAAPVPTAVAPGLHLRGEWLGSFERSGRTVHFVMRLEQQGDVVSGAVLEIDGDVSLGASVYGSVSGSALTFEKKYNRSFSTVSYTCSEATAERLRGTWKTWRDSGTWEADWKGDFTDSVQNVAIGFREEVVLSDEGPTADPTQRQHHARGESWRLRPTAERETYWFAPKRHVSPKHN